MAPPEEEDDLKVEWEQMNGSRGFSAANIGRKVGYGCLTCIVGVLGSFGVIFVLGELVGMNRSSLRGIAMGLVASVLVASWKVARYGA